MRAINYATAITRKRIAKRKLWELISAVVLYFLFVLFTVVLLILIYDRFLFKKDFQSIVVKPWENPTIGDSFRVESYDLDLYPDFYNEKYGGILNGNATINMELNRLTKFLLLHCKFISIREIKVVKNNLESVTVVNNFLNENNSYCVFELDKSLSIGTTLTLEISFVSQVFPYGTKKGGLFLESETNQAVNEIENTLWTDNFQPNNARSVYPCIDEPTQKSYFSIHLTHLENYTALSNMPLRYREELQTKHPNGHRLIKSHFYRTVKPMGTYLTAFVITNAYSVQDFSTPNKTIRVYAPRNCSEISKAYVQNIGKTIRLAIPCLEELLDSKDPWPKVEFVLLKHLIPMAMENWGLVTMKFSQEELHGNLYHQFLMTEVVVHELCHIWFGNMITNQFWDEMWLNEGLSTYCETTVMRKIQSHFKVETWWVELPIFEKYRGILKSNSKYAIVPYEKKVIYQVYYQACGLLLWTESIVGSQTMIETIQNYIQVYQYKSVTGRDFWSLLEKKVKGISKMSEWFYLGSHPMVSVRYIENEFKVQQRPRLFSRDQSDFGTIWPIWLSYKSSLSENQTTSGMVFFNEDEINTDLGLSKSQLNQFDVDEESWILFNTEGFGYYVTNYEGPLWRKICRALDTAPHKFTVLQKAVLLEDAFLLNRMKEQDVIYLLDLLKYFRKETDSYLWVKYALPHLVKLFGHHPVTLQFSKIFEKSLNSVQKNNETETMFKKVACLLEMKSCLQNSWRQVQIFLLDNSYSLPINKSTVQNIQYGLVYNNTDSVWKELFQVYKRHNLTDILTSLLVTRSPTRILTTLREIMKHQINLPSLKDQFRLHQNLWNFVMKNCIDHHPANPTDSDMVAICDYIMKPEYVAQLVSSLNTEKQLEEYNRFKSLYGNKTGGYIRVFKHFHIVIEKTMRTLFETIEWCQAEIREHVELFL